MNASSSPRGLFIGLFTTDTRLIIQSWDDRLAQVSGISQEEAVGLPLASVVTNLEERGLLAPFQRVLEEGVVEVLSPIFHHYLIPCPPPISSVFFKEMQQKVTLAPIKKGEEIVGVLVTVEDVTARLEEERKLAEDLAGPDETKRLRAAQLLSEREEGRDGLLRAISDESWRIRRTAVNGLIRQGGAEAVLSLIQTMRQEHRDLGTLNSALQVLIMSDIDVVPPLLEILKDPDPELRLYITQTLGEKADPRAVPALISLLRDEDSNVRYQAVEGLGKLRAPEAVEPLMGLVESKDFFLAFPALEALTLIGDGSITSRIIPLLGDELFREPATKLIGRLGDEQAVPPLIKLLNENEATVLPVARALAEMYDRYEHRLEAGEYIRELVSKAVKPSGIRHLLDALPRAEQEDLRPLSLVLGWLEGPAVERALTRLIGNPQIHREVLNALVRYGPRVNDLLIEQLQSEDLEVRQSAVIALGRIGDPGAVPALITVLKKDPELTVVSAGALAKIGDRRAFEALLGLLGAPQAAVRQAVISALNSIAHPEMEGRIAHLLHDIDPRIRESAVRIAGYFGYPTTVTRILEMAKDPSEEVRRVVIEHLPYLDDPRVLSTVLAALKEDTPKVRASAAKALAFMESPESFLPLVEALKDPDPWVRYYATRSLSRLKAEGPLEDFFKLVHEDPAPQVRIAVLESLGSIEGDQALEILNTFLNHPEYDLARAAIRSLGQSGHPGALSSLLKALQTKETNKKKDVIYALGKKGAKEAVEALQWTAATEREEEVARAALDVLSRMESPEAAAALIHLSADPRLRQDCLEALSQIREEHIAWLEEGLGHPQTKVRQTLVMALARKKNPKASALIQKALKDPDWTVRLSAVTALEQLGNRSVAQELARLMANDEDVRVRQAAAKALGTDPFSISRSGN